MRTELFLSALLSIGLLACAGDKDGTADTDTDAGGDTDTTPSGESFDITGNGIDVATQAPAAAGLCVRLLDPTPAVAGGVPTELATGTLDASGGYSFTGVTEKPAIGLLVEIADCGTANTTVFTSATGIGAPSYTDLADGEVLSGVRSFSIDMGLLAGMQGSAAPLGWTGDLETDGLLFGFVVDGTGAPIDGATVTCSDCPLVFYNDGNPDPGLFAAGATPNTGTIAAAGASFMIPAATITQYTAEDGGAHTFAPVLIGSNPGSATIAAFFGE